MEPILYQLYKNFNNIYNRVYNSLYKISQYSENPLDPKLESELEILAAVLLVTGISLYGLWLEIKDDKKNNKDDDPPYHF